MAIRLYESELLYIPYDEWEYMGDENENGIPDFFEDSEDQSKAARDAFVDFLMEEIDDE